MMSPPPGHIFGYFSAILASLGRTLSSSSSSSVSLSLKIYSWFRKGRFPVGCTAFLPECMLFPLRFFWFISSFSKIDTWTLTQSDDMTGGGIQRLDFFKGREGDLLQGKGKRSSKSKAHSGWRSAVLWWGWGGRVFVEIKCQTETEAKSSFK